MSYKIKYLHDEYDCEGCGVSYAEGYVITKDDVTVVDKTPVAHCYDGSDYYGHSPYKDIAALEGIEIEEEIVV